MNAPVNSKVVLESRPLYGIGTVARLTGLKPDTLRVWERRYGLGASYKSPSGRRQYTQSDLEHLQIIATLVNEGARIGEIASSERKTLEMLVRNRGKRLERTLPPTKPKAVFVGGNICRWLDEHQGCMSAVSAFLVRQDLSECFDSFDVDGDIDVLVVDCPSVSMSHIDGIEAMASQLGASRTLVTYKLANDRWLAEMDRRGFTAIAFPPDPGRLAFELSRVAVEAETQKGEFDLGELVEVKERRFSDQELEAARNVQSVLACECPRHIADLIGGLADFEVYSTQCSVENWEDAAVHSRIYAYASQARHLMEKAMAAVLEERSVEFEQALKAQRRG